MGSKLGKGEFPSGHSPADFKCFGPPATVDGSFEGTMIADMGCFTQDGKDSNKYYSACVCQSTKDNKWYAYFEWGRTGAQRPDCQFVECSSKEDAEEEYTSQCHSKNDKRGEWTTIAGIKTLRAKTGKDCYLVRAQATRSTGLPDARTIKSNEGAKQDKVQTADSSKSKTAKLAPKSKVDTQTLSLMRDLNVATLQYSKGQMATGSLPTQTAIDEGRQILTEAQKQVAKVGDDLKSQIKDRQLNDLSKVLYSRIPKIKPVGADPSTWVLSKDNIFSWQQDLDAFEQALYSENIEAPDTDPFGGMDIDMSWVAPDSDLGKWLYRWAPSATRGRHSYLGKMRIHNLWRVERKGDFNKIANMQKECQVKGNCEKPLFQGARPDLGDKGPSYYSSNTCLLYHGSRSVNVSSILRKSFLSPRQLTGVTITGAMFGIAAAYLADDFAKSAGYTSLDNSYWSSGSGAVKGRKAFLFLVDSVLGIPYVAPGPRGFSGPPNGYHSVFGKAGVSGVQNNEFIVYDTRQLMIRYLIEFNA